VDKCREVSRPLFSLGLDLGLSLTVIAIGLGIGLMKYGSVVSVSTFYSRGLKVITGSAVALHGCKAPAKSNRKMGFRHTVKS